MIGPHPWLNGVHGPLPPLIFSTTTRELSYTRLVPNFYPRTLPTSHYSVDTSRRFTLRGPKFPPTRPQSWVAFSSLSRSLSSFIPANYTGSANIPYDDPIVVSGNRRFNDPAQPMGGRGTQSRSVRKRRRRAPKHFPSAPQRKFQVPRASWSRPLGVLQW